MTDSRAALLEKVINEVAVNGLVDRSLRDVATASGTSHRMLIYHFGSREGLVEAIVAEIEQRQRQLMADLAGLSVDGPSLMRTLWAQVSSPELRPFVRLFFETLAASSGASSGDSLTSPWIEDGRTVSEMLGETSDDAMLRLGTAVTRGLLIDVLATGTTEDATVALERFIEMWESFR